MWMLVACAAVLIVAGLLVVGSGGDNTPETGRLPLRSGTWRLAETYFGAHGANTRKDRRMVR